MLKQYYLLAKPGIIYGNAVSAAAGFFLASQGHFSLGVFVAMLVGISLVMGSGCVFNNYIDRGIDALMKRTRGRALVKGTISARNALAYGTILGLIGLLILALSANRLTAGIALLGFVIYVVLYALAKRRSEWGTVVGSLAGAVPPVVGYTAVSNHFDGAALILFLILVIWQMPHFYAIAIFRADDYAAAALPVLPVRRGVRTTKVHMLLYIVAFLIVSVALTLFGHTGYVYLVVTALLSLAWLRIAAQGFQAENDIVWARKLFRFSLIVLVILCIVISLNAVLP